MRTAAAYVNLMRRVFDPSFEMDAASPWRPNGLFDHAGSCTAGAETCVLNLMLDGAPVDATAIRLVAVAPEWRGLGLFRDLMDAAIAWCENAAPGPILLYTETEGLYTRFGFTPIAQHAFAGPAPPRIAGRSARPLAPKLPRDRALVDRLLAARTAVSDRCAVLGPPAIFLAKIAAAQDVALAYADTLDAVIVYENRRRDDHDRRHRRRGHAVDGRCARGSSRTAECRHAVPARSARMERRTPARGYGLDAPWRCSHSHAPAFHAAADGGILASADMSDACAPQHLFGADHPPCCHSPVFAASLLG